MTRSEHDEHVVEQGSTDVLAEDEVVQVPAAAAELAEAVQYDGETFVADVPDWDRPDPLDGRPSERPHGLPPTERSTAG